MPNPSDTTLKEQAILNRVFLPDINALAVANADGTPLGSGGSGAVIVDNETPSGPVNGSNVDFTTFYSYKPGTVKLFLNGLRQREGLGFDYIENGTNQIKFALAPLTGDTLTADYTKL